MIAPHDLDGARAVCGAHGRLLERVGQLGDLVGTLPSVEAFAPDECRPAAASRLQEHAHLRARYRSDVDVIVVDVVPELRHCARPAPNEVLARIHASMAVSYNAQLCAKSTARQQGG